MRTTTWTAIALIGQIVMSGTALANDITATGSTDTTSSTVTTQTGNAGTTTTQTSGTGTTTATAIQTGGTSEVGASDALSPGNRKIAESLFNSQTVGSSGQQAWSLDQIAAAKQSGQGWGEIFKQMKADGLIQAKNLGQVVSGHYQPATTTTGSTTVIVTNAAGGTSAVGSVGGTTKMHGSAGRSLQRNELSGAGGVTAGGMTVGRGAGNAYGHLAGGAGYNGASAGAGITSAGGHAAGLAGAVHGNGGGHGRGK